LLMIMPMKKKPDLKLSKNMEDYLEAIVVLGREKGVVRVKDISKRLKVSTPSVSGALVTLEQLGLVVHERYGYIELSPEGEKIASEIDRKHRTLKRFLELILRLDSKTAEQDACEIEHAISSETFQRFLKFISFVETCPAENLPDWLNGFYEYLETGKITVCK
jgi:DtxR family Mn-dependent transcriptional regulator